MDLKITVIIPVYNTAQYLDKCIGSVVAQTYKNLEIILVDDGSTDNSHEICQRWAKEDSRIVLIHKKNEGLSSARNVALDRATGAYVAFVDSDDWIERDMYEVLLRALIDSGKDAAQCKIGEEHWPEEDMYLALIRDHVGSQLVKFLFSAHLWNGIRMPIGRYAQDAAVLHEVLYQRSIELVNRDFYHYFFENPTSTSNAPQNKLKGTMDRAIIFAKRYEWMRDKNIDKESQRIVLSKSIGFFIGAMGLFRFERDVKIQDDVYEMLAFSKRYYGNILKSKYISFLRKIAISIICFSPKLYYKIKNNKYF